MIGILLLLSSVHLHTVFAEPPYGTKLLPYQCKAGADVHNADCRLAYTKVCSSNTFKTAARQDATVGQCTASWIQPVNPSSGQKVVIDEETCLNQFHRILSAADSEHVGSLPERYVGGTVLIHTSPEQALESSFVARLEPPHAEPCCYAQRDCDPSKAFGRTVTCASDHGKDRRSVGVSHRSPVRSDLALVKRDPNSWSCAGLAGSATFFGMSCLIAALVTYAGVGPIALLFTGFFCVNFVGMTTGAGIECAAPASDDTSNHPKRAISSQAAADERKNTFCSDLERAASANSSMVSSDFKCARQVLLQECRANNGKIDPTKLFVAAS